MCIEKDTRFMSGMLREGLRQPYPPVLGSFASFKPFAHFRHDRLATIVLHRDGTL